MRKFINPLMGIISGLALMLLNVLGPSIVGDLYLRLTGGNTEFYVRFEWIIIIIHTILSILSIIGMIATIISAIIILKILVKSYKNPV
ncbi:hypothetical protein JGS6364_14341 [[Clostridium] sordellii]|uniref:hypothetical protein n=1 Tax=Paraclostridium sordellii TaxID=1505 RepID=UPI00030ECB84|nr:hypothetical protein [Paeniclostridium sordellii]TAN67236.1 hypothetical protein WS9_008975 [Paeniclostridium sordellii 8483]CEK30788.1 hypothetical protein JGS6364_14341 [[Clostridium] sordellii] [Paeniclostridium sordellii]